jgi:hypothetical protein
MSAAFARGAADAAGPAAGSAPAGGPAAAAPPPSEGASPLSVEVLADRTAVTVGDPVRLTFRMRHPPGVAIVSFDADRSLAGLTLLDQVEAGPRALEDGRVEEARILTLAAYETGTKEIAPVRIVYRDAGGREGSVSTAPVTVEVASVLAAGQTEPADIKPPVAMPERAIWPWVALAALLVGAAIAVLWWRRRRRGAVAAAAAPPEPPRPAHEIAYAELERLLASGMIERGEIKLFHIELAEIVRRYIGGRYRIDTFERTTFEILAALHVARLPIAVTTMAAELLGTCDLVKFAKYLPDQDETRRTVERAYRLVDETRVAPAPAAAPPAAPVAAAGGAP